MVAATTDRAGEIGAEIGAQQAQAYREAIEESVLTAVEVTHQHKLAARRAMAVGMDLLAELERASRLKEVTEAEIEQCRVDDAARAAMIDRQLGVKARVEALDKWATSFARLAAVEREAHEIGQAEKGAGVDELLKKIHTERLAGDHRRPLQ